MYLPLLFTYPKLMESTQAGKDTPAQPTAVTAFGRVPWCMDFHLGLHCPSGYKYCLVQRQAYVREVSTQLVTKSFAETSEQATATGQYDIAHENLTQIRVTGTERFTDQLRYTFWKIRVGCLQVGQGECKGFSS
jgi:hypothetical protein